MGHFPIGARVTQAQYGDGTVSSVDTYHTRIEFDVHGLRTFRSEQVVLTPASTLAPVKIVRPRRRKAADSDAR